MAKSIFVDLTLCTGCRGCQVACKQWKKLPGEKTHNRGSYQNPEDLSYNTIRLVRFTEVEEKGKLEWLFFPEQCRHCFSAPCKRYADGYDSSAIAHEESGAVVFTDTIVNVPQQGVRKACPYDIPRPEQGGKKSSKCDFCYDRIAFGMAPACVLSCPTGCMNFGEETDMLELAQKRLCIVQRTYPKAYLGDPLNVRVIYLYQTDHRLYYQDSV